MMKISTELREFLQNNSTLVKTFKFKELYDAARQWFHTQYNFIDELTRMFMNANVNPLKFMTSVPAFYLNEAPDVETIQIPDNIKTVEMFGFDSCQDLTSVFLAEGVEKIMDYGFVDCAALEQIVLPKTLKSLGDECFAGCTKLTTLNYTGTMDEWKKISQVGSWRTKSSISEVCCVDGSVYYS